MFLWLERSSGFDLGAELVGDWCGVVVVFALGFGGVVFVAVEFRGWLGGLQGLGGVGVPVAAVEEDDCWRFFVGVGGDGDCGFCELGEVCVVAVFADEGDEGLDAPVGSDVVEQGG